MRLLLTFLFLSSYLIGHCQIDKLKFDSSKDSIVVMINISGHYFSNVFYNFNLSTDHKISLNQGFNSSRTDSVYIVDINPTSELEVIWSDLVDNNVLILPDQSEVEIIIENDGKPFPLGKDSKQKILESLSGNYFFIEVWFNGAYREYGFIDSDRFYKFFQEKIYSSEDINKMHNIANIVFTDLDFRKIQIELVQNVLEKN